MPRLFHSRYNNKFQWDTKIVFSQQFVKEEKIHCTWQKHTKQKANPKTKP